MIQAKHIKVNPIEDDLFISSWFQFNFVNLVFDLRETFLDTQTIDVLSVRDELAMRVMAQKLDRQPGIEVVAVRMSDQQEIHVGEGSAASNYLGKQFRRRAKNLRSFFKESVNKHLLTARLHQEAFVADVSDVERRLRCIRGDFASRIGVHVLLRWRAGTQKSQSYDRNAERLSFHGYSFANESKTANSIHLTFVSRWDDGKAAFEAQEWLLVQLIRGVCYEDGEAESEGCSQAVAPADKMECMGKPGKPSSAGREDKEINQFMKEIQAVRDASQIEDGLRQVF
jgi:hypothetical protein